MTEKRRYAKIERTTNETQIAVAIDLDGEGKAEIQTGVGFMDHMLDLFIKHGLFNGTIQATGDTYIDDHHTTEDIGIVLGQAIREALGDKKILNVTEQRLCRWMMHWHRLLSIAQTVHI